MLTFEKLSSLYSELSQTCWQAAKSELTGRCPPHWRGCSSDALKWFLHLLVVALLGLNQLLVKVGGSGIFNKRVYLQGLTIDYSYDI